MKIMSGVIDYNNYLTGISLGMLEDLGFKVNYTSEYAKITDYSKIIVL